MGGNALKHTKTSRLTAAEYHHLADKVVATLAQAWPEAKPHLVRSYGNKPDFGDMDVIVDGSGVPQDVAEQLRALFGSQEVVHNGPVWSCDVEGLQLDLIRMPSQDYATAVDYFAYNDCGNLMGRIARRLGFKYGHQGLSYLLREGDHLVAEIEVSRDPESVFRFLGFVEPQYDYRRFCRGFKTLQGMFAFVASSKFFDKTAYALEERNHTARTRDRKRASYRAFLEWLADGRVESGPAAGLPHDHHRSRAKIMFPEFAMRLNAAEQAHGAAKRRREIFNGQAVSALTGRTGKELGTLMAQLRQRYAGGPAAFDAWLDSCPSQEAIDAYVMDKHTELTRVEVP
jgi:hypothetical protein